MTPVAPSDPSRLFFIVNKHAGTGFQEKVEGRIIDYCRTKNLEPTIQYTQGRGHATLLARHAVESGFQKVIVMGGDGTVNEAAQSLIHSNSAMGILPAGSGNGLARHLGIPLKFRDALQVAGEGQVIQMDALQINHHLSFNVSGIGFDAHVASRFGSDGRRGLVGYTRLVLREFLKFGEFTAKGNLDGKEISNKAFVIALANSSQFGNNAKVAPYASVCDGVMDVCFLRKVPFTEAIPFTARMFTGRIDQSRYVVIQKAQRVQLELDHPLAYHIDGEPFPPTTAIDASVLPAALRMIVPSTRTEF